MMTSLPALLFNGVNDLAGQAFCADSVGDWSPTPLLQMGDARG